jgi:plastocyanin
MLTGLVGSAVLGMLSLSGPAQAATVTVVIPASQLLFFPRVVVINVGDTVTWQNASGGMTHTVTSDDGGATFDSGSLGAGATFSHQFANAGVFPYSCTVSTHAAQGMRGIVIVGSATRTARLSSEIAVTLSAWNFDADGADAADTVANADNTRTLTAGSATLRAGLTVPAGALITGVEVAGCDNGSGTLDATLKECADPPGTTPVGVCNTVATASLSVGGGGCGFAFGSPTAGSVSWTTDNYGYTYIVEASLSNNQALRSVRVFYKKQISPPPTTATFGDVPTNHGFFQFIEAMVKAGITSGCLAGNPPNYCPDNPVTRGQMAVFLSRLGGLNWPN